MRHRDHTHAGKPDDLMDEIPTVVVDPLPDRNTTYIVLNRPYAFMQWMKLVSIPEVRMGGGGQVGVPGRGG